MKTRPGLRPHEDSVPGKEQEVLGGSRWPVSSLLVAVTLTSWDLCSSGVVLSVRAKAAGGLPAKQLLIRPAEVVCMRRLVALPVLRRAGQGRGASLKQPEAGR